MDAPGVKGELRARSQDSDEACLMPATKTPPKGGKKGGKKSPPRWVWIAVAVAVVIAGVLWLRSRSSSTTEGNPSGYANYPSGSAYGTGGYLSPDDITAQTGTTTNPSGTSTTTATDLPPAVNPDGVFVSGPLPPSDTNPMSAYPSTGGSSGGSDWISVSGPLPPSDTNPMSVHASTP